MKEHFQLFFVFVFFSPINTSRLRKVAAHVKDPTPTFRYEVRPDDSTKITDEGNRLTDQNSTPNRRRSISVGGRDATRGDDIPFSWSGAPFSASR